jgi:pimeloyl-ACP methyl ester carboxylesterase
MIDALMTMGSDALRDRRLARRSALSGAAGAVIAGLATSIGTPLRTTAQDATPSVERGPGTFVLVAGSFSGGWMWDKVVPLLRAAGHDVYAVTLTGLGERVHLANPAIDLDTHVTDVVNVLEFEDLRNVTLVAHSSGGMVTTGVAERVPERLAQLVYLDAWVPADNQSDLDFSIPSEEDRAGAIAYLVNAGWEADMPGLVPVEPGGEEGFADPADAAWVQSKLTPHPLAAWTQPIRLGNPDAATLPRAFIFCTEGKGTADEDPTVRVAEQVRSDPNWTYLELAAGHMVLVNDPEATAEALASLV